MPRFISIIALRLARCHLSNSGLPAWRDKLINFFLGRATKKAAVLPHRAKLSVQQHPTATACTGCGKCRAVCPFLQVYGTPKEICGGAEGPEGARDIAYRCSLCGLCNEVCPENLDLTSFFLAMRHSAVDAGVVSWRPYLPMLFYEWVGRSPLFSLEILSQGCDTVFFPGCALPGAYPEETLSLFQRLRLLQPHLGIILDCCNKPSHDLGRAEVFASRLGKLLARLTASRISTVITACPSCADLFRSCAPNLHITTVYQYLAERQPPVSLPATTLLTVHDACVLRRDSETQMSVRSLLVSLGYQVVEMDHSRQQTLCCGQGGMVAAVDRPLADAWTEKRLSESRDLPMVVYCAGCAASFTKATPTLHLAQLLSTTGQTALPGKPAFPPLTYWNRLRLKWRLLTEARRKKP
jgi:Fe-S oxidoreductase